MTQTISLILESATHHPILVTRPDLTPLEMHQLYELEALGYLKSRFGFVGTDYTREFSMTNKGFKALEKLKKYWVENK